MDLPGKLIDAYGIILAADIWEELNLEKNDNLKNKIEWFFTNNADHLISQKTELTNMHPYLWINVVKLGKLLGRLEYLHYLIPDMQKLLNKGFFADGTWHEGSPDYFIQTLKGILEVCRAYDGWTDTQDYIPSELDIRFDGEPIENKLPMISRAKRALKLLCFPNGERLTLHDSWGWEKYPYPEVPFDYCEKSFLLPSLGHACLAGGKGSSAGRLDFTFGGGYGHQHMDGLSIMLTAYGHEMLSDIGYTHTKYRSWTLSTACHNTVVIDHESQDSGSLSDPTDGSLSFMSVSSPFYQAVRAENTAAYSKKAFRYERSLSRVNINDESFYVIDLFDVEGGAQHDYFLHGDCIAQQALSCSAGGKELSFEGIDTLLPDGAEFNLPSGEHQANDCLIPGYAYGFLRNIGRASAADNSWIKAELVYTGKAVGEKPAAAKQGPGLAIHLYTAKGDTVYTGTNPSVRQGRYNDDILDEYQRAFVMLRKRPAENGASEKGSVFLSIVEPYYEAPLINNIACLKKSGSSVLLRVDHNDSQDFIFYNLNIEEQLLHFEKPLQLKGHSGFVRFSGCKITAAWTASGRITYGDFCLEAESEYTGALLEASDEHDGGILTITDPNSKMNPQCGEYVLLRRDNLVFGMKVLKAEYENGRTRLFVKDHPGFSYCSNESKSEDTVFPNRIYKGRHGVSWIPVAEWQEDKDLQE